jgi:hypothetical protein
MAIPYKTPDFSGQNRGVPGGSGDKQIHEQAVLPVQVGSNTVNIMDKIDVVKIQKAVKVNRNSLGFNGG